jgi:peptide/nickel transport system permease protein
VTIVGLGSIIGGSVLMESIFQYPGMGLLLFNAARSRDFPLLMGGVLFTATLFILGTLIADFTYKLIDPRAEVNVSR